MPSQFLFDIQGVNYRPIEFVFHERISFPFEGTISLASLDEIGLDETIGKNACLTIAHETDARIINGIVSQFFQTGTVGRFYLYKANVVPFLWILSLKQNCRIFQNLTTPSIVEKVLMDSDLLKDSFSFRLKNKYNKRDYCVQYRESDLDFISRLLAEEGIFYYFEHSNNNHVIVFSDSDTTYQSIPNFTDIVYNPVDDIGNCVYEFSLSRQIRSGKITLKDFNPRKPKINLKASSHETDYKKLEIYDYPGFYQEKKRGESLANIRLQEANVNKDAANGKSRCPQFLPGYTFQLINHDVDYCNQSFLIYEVEHTGAQFRVLEEMASTEKGFSYSNRFKTIPDAVIYRPERVPQKPVINGIQTAIVVGPENETIYTDDHGRVKVQFHWDREGEYNDKSSCWIRVSQSWAGKNWGMFFLPRIGQEVIVSFLDGNPDRPIITGSVYNSLTLPPYTPSEFKTRSAIKTFSYNNDNSFNEISFDDEKDKEQLFIHAAKDQDIRTNNDLKQWIGNDSHLIVEKDRIETIQGDDHLTIHGNQSNKVNNTISIEAAKDLQIKTGKNSALESGSEIHIKSGSNIIIEAGSSITLKAGGSFIVVGSNGVAINGVPILLNSGGSPESGSGVNLVSQILPVAAILRDTPDDDGKSDFAQKIEPRKLDKSSQASDLKDMTETDDNATEESENKGKILEAKWDRERCYHGEEVELIISCDENMVDGSEIEISIFEQDVNDPDDVIAEKIIGTVKESTCKVKYKVEWLDLYEPEGSEYEFYYTAVARENPSKEVLSDVLYVDLLRFIAV